MDIIRDTAPQKRKKTVKIVIGVVALVAFTVFIQQLEPAAPKVDAATIFTDTVKRGPLVRQIRGPGTLVPVERRLVTAVTSGRVESVYVLPGENVTSETRLMTLSNPDVNEALLAAETQLSSAESSLIQLRVNLDGQVIQQRSLVSTLETQYGEARRVHDVNQRLYDRNPELVPVNELDRTRDVASDLEDRLELEVQRLEQIINSVPDQIAAQEAQIDRLETTVRFNQDRVRSMDVTAGYAGVLAELPIEEGAWVQAGGTLGRVVRQDRLKAEIQIPQTQAQEIVVGQAAYVDTRNDTIQGTVARIDPAVQKGTVTIDIALPNTLPASARPDLSVDANVVISQLDDVVYVAKPLIAQANRQIGIFKLVENGEYAERVQVQVGITSVNDMEVRGGLQPGDIIIMSDMSSFDGVDRVKINR